MSSAERAVVWVDAWQMACCGTPFAVGDSIRWTVSSEVDRSFLGRVMSPEVAKTIDYSEEHHDDEVLLGLTGVVRTIRLASCRYELLEGGGSSPAARSGRLQDVVSTGERPGSDGEEGCPGWLVELEPYSVACPPILLQQTRLPVSAAGV